MSEESKSQVARRRSIRAKLTLLVLASVGIAVTLVTGVLAWQGGEDASRLTLNLLLSLAAGLTAALAGLAVARRLQHRITGPVVALADAMRKVRESHDYAQSAEIVADDEVADLVGGFNDMLAEIRARDAALEDKVAGLERSLAERSAELDRAREAAEALERVNGELLATVAQELGAPASGVTVLAEMLAVAELAPRHRRTAELIAKSGAGLLAAIDDLDDLAKAGAGRMKAVSGAADVAEIVEDVLALSWERARCKGLDMAAYVDPTLPALIETDPLKLRQVIGALVGAAIQQTDVGAVMVQAQAKGQVLRFSVRDTGAGFSPDDLAKLVEAGPASGKRLAGLSLALCRRRAEAMGGRLTASSEPGKGTLIACDLPLKALAPAPTWPSLEGDVAALQVAGQAARSALSRYLQAAGMTVAGPQGIAESPGLVIGSAASLGAAPRLKAPVLCLAEYGDGAPAALQAAGMVDLVLTQPLRRRELGAALAQLAARAPLGEAQAAAARAEAALPSFHGRKALIADPSAATREVALEALARLGVAATLAPDGPTALDAAKLGGFDVILVSPRLPGLDGFALAGEIRRHEGEGEAARTPILALAAHAAEAPAEAWREADMDGVVGKPIGVARLAATLAELIAPASAPSRPAAVAESPRPLTVSLGPSAASDLLDPQVTGELARLAASGKGDFVERVRRLYRDNAPAAVKAVIEASTQRDCEAVARAANALKSMSLNMGARLVAETAARLEAQARELKVVNVDQAQILHRQLLATLDVLEGYPPALAAIAENAAPDEESLLADLAQSLDREELTLVYQPQFDREGETITGIETLVRWNHATRGFVSPAFFIPIAERYGLIGRVTQYVLARAMRETEGLGDFTISFNASAVEFADPAFVDELAVLIARHRFDPKRLEIEVTETAVLAEEEGVRRNMARLHELGLKIALDDFGVGYSSLSHLRLFPFDKLKIDRAFVTGCAENVQSATLVHAVVSIGRALGMKVVAEGVETEAQRKFLKVAGVHAMQGYLFAKPEPIDALKARLAAAQTPQTMSA